MKTIGFQSSLLILSSLMAGATVHAGTQTAGARSYTCVTKAGESKRGDQPFKECSDVPQKVLNGNGVQIDTLEPVKTLREQEEDEERRRLVKEAADRIRAQKISDDALMKKYPNEAALQKARKAETAVAQSAIDRLQSALSQLQRDRLPFDNQAGFFEGTFKDKMPVALKNQLGDFSARQEGIHSMIDLKRADLLTIDRKFDEELRRLRQLHASR